ncbi:MAG TPA: T9SS type A sorting domain-containing protein, partial [Bacteroidales bacterium]|nr:T9SS type A sorting domain-containing protein [Bacteroidales bacterium]
GTAYVKVCGMNGSGVGPVSDSLMVTINEAPSAEISGDAMICPGEEVTLSVALTGTGPWSLMIDNESYTANSSPFTFTVEPSATTTYMVSSVEDASGCVNTGMGSAQVDVLAEPEKPGTPTGPGSVNSDDDPSSTFATDGATNADGYEWMVSPSEAYTDIDANDMELTITWDNTFKGDVNISVRGMNGECPGDYSDEFTVVLESSYGIDELANALGIALYPNPNQGSFTLEMSTDKVEKVNVRIVNALGYAIYTTKELNVNKGFNTVIDISGEADGIYMLIVESDLGVYTSRFVISK